GVQNILDKPGLSPGPALDCFQRVTQSRLVELSGSKYLDPAQHRVERSAEFMGDSSQELVLGAVRGFGFSAGALFAFKQLDEAILSLNTFGHIVDNGDCSNHFAVSGQWTDTRALLHLGEGSAIGFGRHRQQISVQSLRDYTDLARERIPVVFIEPA